jgi:hypothetical protein
MEGRSFMVDAITYEESEQGLDMIGLSSTCTHAGNVGKELQSRCCNNYVLSGSSSSAYQIYQVFPVPSNWICSENIQYIWTLRKLVPLFQGMGHC